MQSYWLLKRVVHIVTTGLYVRDIINKVKCVCTELVTRRVSIRGKAGSCGFVLQVTRGFTNHSSMNSGMRQVPYLTSYYTYLILVRTGHTQPPTQYVPWPSLGHSGCDVNLITHIHLLPRLRMRGATAELPPHAYTVYCLDTSPIYSRWSPNRKSFFFKFQQLIEKRIRTVAGTKLCVSPKSLAWGELKNKLVYYVNKWHQHRNSTVWIVCAHLLHLPPLNFWVLFLKDAECIDSPRLLYTTQPIDPEKIQLLYLKHFSIRWIFIEIKRKVGQSP
jgi:hypothetical protein